jgi:hypothetical protein
MRTFIYLFLLIPLLTSAQQPDINRRTLREPLVRNPVRFQVTTMASDKNVRMESLQNFRLTPNETKAVAQTGNAILRLDKPVPSLLNGIAAVKNVFMVPELYYAKVAGTNEQISYRILFVDSSPMRLNLARNVFEGSIRVLPVEENSQEGVAPVSKTLSVPEEVLVSAGGHSIPLTILKINWPPIDVPVSDSNPVDSFGIRILTVTNPLGYPKNLPVEPAIILSSTRTKIQGLGIQTLPVHIALKGVSSYKPVPVSVETSLGTIDSASLVLTGDQPREVILRSESLGTIHLKVINPNYRSNTISLEAVFPWLFILLAVLGGLIGGLGKNLLGKEKVTLRPLALGSIIGLIAAVAYWGLGIILIGVSIETRGLNEAMVFGFGLIAGFFGVKLVTR